MTDADSSSTLDVSKDASVNAEDEVHLKSSSSGRKRSSRSNGSSSKRASAVNDADVRQAVRRSSRNSSV